jgi:predicted hydrolase (HD superfamily)
MITKEQAMTMLYSMVESENLRRHCLTVGLVMEAYATQFGEDPSEWFVAGVLHDADYEKYPEDHPNVMVKQLNEMGEHKLAYAVSAHYTPWGKAYHAPLEKALVACDEMTGFVVAACLIRPARIEGLTVKSVKEKFKVKTFAAGVDRAEVMRGVELLGVDFAQHIQHIITVLYAHKESLKLVA